METLNQLVSSGALSFLDIHFARLMAQLGGRDDPELLLAAALVSSTTRQGHICFDLHEPSCVVPEGEAFPEGAFPDPARWCENLQKSQVVGKPGEFKPLILDGHGRLYIYRYWEYQQKLVDGLKPRMHGLFSLKDADRLHESLARLFEKSGKEELDWQMISALAAACKPFCTISGGPGTGKTTTVVRILALLLEQSGSESLRIALAAPTGKAAARLQEAIKREKLKLTRCPEPIVRAIPETASTLHRLLGSLQGSPYFKHNEENRLPVDVMVVDEASMVDLALMSKLVQALPPKARLILLGDKDQLSSVEAGAVLGDICDSGSSLQYSRVFADTCRKALCPLMPEHIGDEEGDTHKDCIIELRKNHRFQEGSGIARLSEAVRERDAEAAAAILKGKDYSDLQWEEMSSCRSLPALIRKVAGDSYRAYFEAVKRVGTHAGEDTTGALMDVFTALDQFRILCAVRKGPCGVVALNAMVEEMARGVSRNRRNPWYPGRPVIILRNDYGLRLFNGDIGIYLQPAGSEGRVFFPGAEEKLRHFHPMRLPEHETVYAMTVHKSQGSEFTNVLFIMPEMDSPVLTRELVYTAITRARETLCLCGQEKLFKEAILRSTLRLSGLSEALWKSS